MSQRLDVLNYLQDGHTLTGLEALVMFGSMRLAARVDEIRAKGIPIRTTMINIRGKRVARYSL